MIPTRSAQEEKEAYKMKIKNQNM